MTTGTTFNYGKETYKITNIDTLNGLDNFKNALIKNDKKPIQIFAQLVLKSGKKSVRSAGFFVFNCGAKFIKL